MKKLTRLVVWSVALFALPTAGLHARTLIHAGRLVDVRSSTVVEDRTLVVEGEWIVEVADGFLDPGEGDRLIDLRSFTVLPGLMDMHTHLSTERHRDSYLESFQLDPADYAIRAVVHAERTLLAGFTTVRDVGDRYDVTIALRNAIRDGLVPGPRIYTAAKSLATTGGHADPTNGLRADLEGDPGPKEGVVNSVEDAAKAVRQRYKDGADLIKITATGGVLSLAKSGQNPQFTEEVIRAVVDTARDYDFTVAAHAHGAEGMKRAIRAGVTSIEHGTYMDDEVIALMKEHGTFYVPTILAGKWVAEKAAIDGFFPEVVRPKAAAIGPQIEDTFRRAYQAGVTIAFGTDSGVSPHGENARELEYMVAAGMPAMAAIRSATVVAARLLRAEDELGTLEPGHRADVIAVPGDPLADVTLLQEVPFVMKDGVVYSAPSAASSPSSSSSSTGARNSSSSSSGS
jgi:imidazolonepropionase-like amidohydrolase